jgi:hypothetical protein
LLKSCIKSITLAFTYIAAVLTPYQFASAQLNIGRYGVQPGLEYNYLQYQLSGRDLTRIRTIPVCTVGFGVGCNKPGSVIQQLLESNKGLTYNDLILRAAGGEENLRNFASFYGNNPNIPLVPHSSFWENDNPFIMDGYRYTLGNTVSRSPVQGLGNVTRNFYWSPEGVGSSISPRDGLLNLKYSYGRLLLQEASQIPNLQQQIQALNLEPEATRFYQRNISQGIRALRSGNETQLKQNILEILSALRSPYGGEFGRPNIGFPEEFTALTGQGLPADDITVVTQQLFGEEVVDLGLPPDITAQEVLIPEAVGAGFPYWTLAAIPLIALPFIIGGGDDDDGDDVEESPPPETPPQPPETPPQPPEIPPQPPEIPPQPPETPPQPPVERIPEPSMLTPLLMLALIMYFIPRRHQRQQIKSGKKIFENFN